MDFGSFAWLAVFPALGFLIVIHEIGHYWVGRKMGIKIEEFGIGFPPRAKVLFVRKGVPFTLNWLPLGGFVRFAGEESGFDDPDSLLSASPARRIPVLAAGVIANLVVAMLLFGLIFAIWGIEHPNGVTFDEIFPASAAQEAGFQAGDRLVSIDGQPIVRTSEILSRINKEGPATFVVKRGAEELTIVAAPRKDPTDGAYRIGVSLKPEYRTESVNPLRAFWMGITFSFELLQDMFLGFATLLGSLFGLAKAPEGGLAGPVGIARITGEAARNGMREYLRLTALLSLNLALINILPIPALDGSRIVFALIEAVRRKKIAPEREAMVHAIGMTLLLGLMFIITVSDVRNAVEGEPAIAPPKPTVTVPTPVSP